MHIKYRLRSPADQQFFAALGVGLRDRNVFKTIHTRGAWLCIELKDREIGIGEGNGEVNEQAAAYGSA